MNLFLIRFAATDGSGALVGGLYVEANSETEAFEKSWRLGLNPGGPSAIKLLAGTLPEGAALDKLLSAEELAAVNDDQPVAAVATDVPAAPVSATEEDQ